MFIKLREGRKRIKFLYYNYIWVFERNSTQQQQEGGILQKTVA